jgi:hypothetical protein
MHSIVSKLLEALKRYDDCAVALRIEKIVYVDQDVLQRLVIRELMFHM